MLRQNEEVSAVPSRKLEEVASLKDRNPSRLGLEKLEHQQDRPPPGRKGFSQFPREPSFKKVDWTLGGTLTGTKPVVARFPQNFDFTGFAPVMLAKYNLLKIANSKIEGELPYCVFQHACVEILNGYLLDILHGLGDP